MTVTIADIAYITGLSPTSLHISQLSTENLISLEAKTTYHYLSIMFSDLTKGTNKCPFIKLSCFGNSVSKPQNMDEAIFIAFALTRLLTPKSGSISNLFFILVCNNRANDKELALAPLMLGCLYRCIYRCCETLLVDPFTLGIFGPIWLLSCWVFMYFPEAMIILSEEDIATLRRKVLNAGEANV